MEQIIEFLDQINYDIILKENVSLEDLKKLLLIIYNELINDKMNPVVKSFLIVTLKHFIELENKFLSSLDQEQDNMSNEDFIQYFLSKENKEIFNKIFQQE